MAGTEALARGLGWFSIGLGLAEVLATKELTRTLGMEGRENLVRGFGVREIGAGIGILTSPGPASGWLWARVAGDALDLAVLTSAFTPDNPKQSNVGAALATVAGVTLLDIICAEQLGQGAVISAPAKAISAPAKAVGPSGPAPNVDAVGAPEGAQELTYTITINASATDLQELWHDAGIQAYIKGHYMHPEVTGNMQGILYWKYTTPTGQTFRWAEHVIAERPGEYTYFQSLPGADIPNEGSLHFRPAPNGEGTEVTLHFRFTPPGGILGQAALRLVPALPQDAAKDILHRFKVVAETGEMPPLQQDV